MANAGTGNIRVLDTVGIIWANSTKFVREIQWVDDNGDIVDDSTLVLELNGVSITVKYQMAANVNPTPVLYQLGPFNPSIPIDSLGLTTMATGNLIVILD